MKKQLTYQALDEITDKVAVMALDLRNAAKLVDADQVDKLTAVWSQVAALQNIISAASELTNKLVIREQIQRQQADIAKLKAGQV